MVENFMFLEVPILPMICHAQPTLMRQLRMHTNDFISWGDYKKIGRSPDLQTSTDAMWKANCWIAWRIDNSSAQHRKKLQSCRCSRVHHTDQSPHYWHHLHFMMPWKSSQHNQRLVTLVIPHSPCSHLAGGAEVWKHAQPNSGTATSPPLSGFETVLQ